MRAGGHRGKISAATRVQIQVGVQVLMTCMEPHPTKILNRMSIQPIPGEMCMIPLPIIIRLLHTHDHDSLFTSN